MKNTDLSVRLVTYKNELRAKGGPSTRIPALEAGLAKRGVNVAAGYFGDIELEGSNLFHLFNVASLYSAEQAMRGLKSFGHPIILSPIYLDDRCRHLWTTRVIKAFTDTSRFQAAIDFLSDLPGEAEAARARHILESRIYPDGESSVADCQRIKRLIMASDHLIFLSAYERALLTDLTSTPLTGTLIPNPVDSAKYRHASKDMFENSYHVRDFVLCVGRIEPRKNQLLLAAALSGTSIPLVLVGDETLYPDYVKLIRAVPNLELITTGHLDSASGMLGSALKACRVFCLPSWSEGAPLAALEAGAAGCNMVLSSFSGEKEYFGDLAQYADPSNLAALREKVLSAHDSPPSAGARDTLTRFVSKKYSIDLHTKCTLTLYRNALLNSSLQKTDSEIQKNIFLPLDFYNKNNVVYFDITDFFYERKIYDNELYIIDRLLDIINEADGIVFIFWNQSKNQFFEISREFINNFDSSPTNQYLHDIKRNQNLVEKLSYGSSVLTLGRSWHRNRKYLNSLEYLIISSSSRLTVFMCDLPYIDQPNLRDQEKYAAIDLHLGRLCRFVNAFCVASESTHQNLSAYLSRHGRFDLPISVVPLGHGLLGDQVGYTASPQTTDHHTISELVENGHYVLSVDSTLPEMSRDLLFRVWGDLVAELGAKAPSLVIIGKQLSEKSLDQNHIDPEMFPRIVILDTVSDEDLKRLFESCMLTVFPSLHDGSGPAIGESLSFGKITLASNRPPINETALETMDLIDPFDPAAWLKRIKLYASSPSHRKQRELEIAEKFTKIDWRETLEGCLVATRTAPPRPIEVQPWDFDCIFDFANTEHLATVAAEPLYTNGDGSPSGIRLRLKITTLKNPSAYLHLACGALRTGIARVLFNGEEISRIAFLRAPEIVRCIPLPIHSATTEDHELVLQEVGPIGLLPHKFVLSEAAEIKSPAILKSIAPTPRLTERRIEIDPSGPDLDLLRLIFTDGWYSLEKNRCWSTDRATLHLPLGDQSGSDYELTLEMASVLNTTVSISHGSSYERVIDVSPGKYHTYTIDIPAGIIDAAATVLDLELKIENPVIPAKIKDSDDWRTLGVAVGSLSLRQAR
ncbi:MAG: glycosyltransferase [Rhodobiaceae bacterium]|nr:glycosyltransferase [Rhodobiaceae bacterium]MCC0018662.1 glycosyltransferase [Rhodobiaceae bacterium]MCC0051010.1 glycosyltransferase [Rhodobiaceae bacterium]MCC0060369.1 glycosyltransferase [Rhodobiaceae bacterium]